MASDVLGACIAAPVPKKSCHRTYRTDFECFAEHVFCIIAPATAALTTVFPQHQSAWHFGSFPSLGDDSGSLPLKHLNPLARPKDSACGQ
jgi:hypothetical protein